MRKAMLILTAFLLNAVSMFAAGPAIRDIDVNVLLDPQDGSAFITEKWDVTVASGTEWYLVRHNLGAADITGLAVSDEGGLFRNVGRWDIDASLEQKARKCGLYQTNGGYEICWGVGSYGDHYYTVTYTMTNAVDLLEDADLFHFQLVTPGLSSVPEHVKARIEVMDTQLDTASVKFWGFGYEGTTALADGALYFESDKFRSNSSLIALAAFDDGTFAGGNHRHETLQSVLDTAMEGADFGKDKEESFLSKIIPALMTLLFFLISSLAIFFAISSRPGGSRSRKAILGMKAKDVSWCRDVPYDGNLVDTDYTMTKLGVSTGSRNIAAAFMLRMIYKGVLRVQKDAKGKTEFAFVPDADLSYMNDEEKSFYEIVQSASGEDNVLQDKEFSKWAKNNRKKLYNWVSPLEGTAVGNLKTDGDLNSSRKYTTKGQERARQAYGFKKFLDDFTNMAEKQSVESVLWQEYLVFASLFGMAEKVAGEMKDINPDVYQQMMPTSTYNGNIGDIIITTNTFGRHFDNGVALGRPAPVSSGTHTSSWGGHGGFSSMGGGGGFHGGGFGGGSR